MQTQVFALQETQVSAERRLRVRILRITAAALLLGGAIFAASGCGSTCSSCAARNNSTAQGYGR